MAKIIHNMIRCNRCGDLSDWTDISVIEHESEDDNDD